MTSIKPLRDRIVVKPEPYTATASGLHVITRERMHTGTVLAVGPGKYRKDGSRMPMLTKVGDRIKFGEFAYPEIVEGNTKLLVMQEADVAAVIE